MNSFCFIFSQTRAAASTWTGAVSSDWGTAGNWSLGTVPTSTTDVTIPDTSTTTYAPSISAGAVCFTVTISVNGILNGNAQTISVNGNWTNSGIFNHGNGTVKFNGGSANGTFVPGASVYGNVEVNKNGPYYWNDLIVSGTAAVSGNFTQTIGELRSGQIDLAGNYVIGASSYGGSVDADDATVINFNHAANDQQIIYSAGGVGANIRVDKAGGTLTVGSDIIVNGWAYVRGTVSGIDTHTLIFGDDYNGAFTPGSLTYGNVELNKSETYYRDHLHISGTANISGNLIQTRGELWEGQINLSGNYIIGAAAAGAPQGSAPTSINLNSVTDQTILYSAGGIGSHIRIDKAGGTLIIPSAISVNGWEYIRGTVTGLSSYTLIFGDDSNGSFVPGNLAYGNVELNKTSGYTNFDVLVVSGTATISGNLVHTDGELMTGQMNLSGNYTIGSLATGSQASTTPTILNLNHGSNNQQIIYNAGGVGAHIRVDKAGGTLSIGSNIAVNSWEYVRGTVTGLGTYTLTFGDDNNGIFIPGNFTYGNIELNKNHSLINFKHLYVSAGTLTMSGSLTVTEGDFNLNYYNATASIGGNVSIAAAGILSAGTNPITVNNNWTNSGTFNHGSGTVTFGGTQNATFVPGSSDYYNIILNRYNYETLTVSGTVNVLGNFTQTHGELLSGQINLSGNYIIGAASDGGSIYGTSTVLNFNHPTNAQQIIYNAGGTGAQVQIDKAGGTFTVSDNIVVCGWNYIRGIVIGLDTHTLIFGDNQNGSFTPGSLVYSNIEQRKTYYDTISVSGTGTIIGNIIHTSGEFMGGQLNLSGNYIVGAGAKGGSAYGSSTVINFNHASNNQQVVYTAGGTAAQIRIDKTGGNFIVDANIVLCGWTYVQGTVVGLDTHTLIFGDNVNSSFTPGNLVYSNIELNKTNYDNLAVSGTATISGNIVHTNGEFGGGQLNLSGDYIIGANAKGGADSSWPTVVNFNGTGSQNITYSSGGTGTTVRIDKTSGSLTVPSSLGVSSWNYIQGTVIGIDSCSLKLGDDFHNSFDPGNLVYNNVEIRETGGYNNFTISGNLNVNGDLSFTSGNLRLDSNNPNINLGGNLSIASAVTYNKGTGTLTFNGTNPSVFTDSSGTPQNIGTVAVNKTNIDQSQNKLTLGSSLTCNTLAVDGTVGQLDTLDLGSGGYTLTLANAGTTANVFTQSGTTIPGNGTIKYTATNSTGNVNIAPTTYNNLLLGGAETYALSGTTAVNGNITIVASSILTAGNSILNLGGNFINQGTFTPGTGTVSLTGAGQTLSGNNSFYNLTKDVASTDTLTFAAGSTTTVLTGGTLTLSGENRDNRLSLRSSISDTTWNLNVNSGAVASLNYLNVRDSNASGQPLTVLNSINSGHNTNWTIIANTAPTTTAPLATQATDGTGIVTITAIIDDIDDDNTVKLKVEYSIDNGSTWHKPYLTSNINTSPSQATEPDIANSNTYQIGTTNPIHTSGGANTLTFYWDTKNALNEMGAVAYHTGVKLRITPNDSAEDGTAQASNSAFTVDNTAPANVDILSLTPAPAQITVVSQTATDPSGLNASAYFFTETSGHAGASNSSWQNSTFVDDNLSPNTEYSYQVKARDIFGNVSNDSSTLSEYTLANIPTNLTLTGNPASIDAVWESNSNPAGTDYFIENITNGTSSGWIQSNVWNSADLFCNQAYAFQVKARNFDHIETVFGDIVSLAMPSCGSTLIFISKPDLRNLKISYAGGFLTLTDLPAGITQLAVSSTPDFRNLSWSNIADKDNLLHNLEGASKLYFKFRTNEGAVSDVIIFDRNGIGGSINYDNSIKLNEGDIVKTSDNFDVYIIKYKNNKQYKRLILSPSVFKSYGHLKWSNLKTILQAQMDSYNTSSLVQVMGDKNVYELTPLGDTGTRRVLDMNKSYDIDSVYEINKTDRDSYKLVK